MAQHIKKFNKNEAPKIGIILIPLLLIFSWFGSYDIWHNNFEKFSDIYFLAALFRIIFTIYISIFFFLLGNFIIGRIHNIAEKNKK